MSDFERSHQFEGPCGDGLYAVASRGLEEARARIASFLGAPPESIALTQSTVEGINHVATSIDWQPGDVVVRTDLEHPAGELPWSRMRDRHGIEVRELATLAGRLDMDDLYDVVRDARLLCLSSLSWNYGTRLPVSEVVDVAHDADTLVLVDAVQSVGQVSVDVTAWGADFVAASGHKWLLGPWGAGVLYVDPESLSHLEPDRIGYASVQSAGEYDIETDDYAFKNTAERFELGTRAVTPYVGLVAAIDAIEAIGLDHIETRIEELTARLRDGLGDRLLSPSDARSGLVTFAADDPPGLVEELAAEGIHIRWLPDPYACRASVHALNTEDDVDRLLEAL